MPFKIAKLDKFAFRQTFFCLMIWACLVSGTLGYSRKKQTQVVEDILFWTSPGNFKVVTLPLEISKKKSFHPWKFSKILWHTMEIPRSETKAQVQDPWKSTCAWVFHSLNTPAGNSASFLIDPAWNFHIFFLQYPWKFHVLNPTRLFLFWNSPFLGNTLQPTS